MTTRILLTCGIVTCCGIAYAVLGADQVSVGTDAGDSALTRESASRIESAMQEPTECSFIDKPLDEALNHFESTHRIRMWIDKQALQDEGINVDTQVTLVMSGVTLETALQLTLEPLALTHFTENGVLKITTQTKADEKLSTRVYPVADLLTLGIQGHDYSDLMRVVMTCTSGKWREQDGEGGAIDPFPNAQSLVIRQTQNAHREIEGILAALRKAKRLQNLQSIQTNSGDPEVLAPAAPHVVSAYRRLQASRTSPDWRRPRIHASE